jgi:DNA polymerase IV
MFRLLGIGVSALDAADGSDFADLLDRRTADAEQAIDRLRERFGDEAIIKGRALDESDDGRQPPRTDESDDSA